MHPLQIVFIGIVLCVAAYLGLRVMSWYIRLPQAATETNILSSWSEAKEGSESAGNRIPMHLPATSEPEPEPVPDDVEQNETVHNDVPKWYGRVAILAAMKDDNGKHVFTNDEIVAKMGKRRTDVLAQIGLYRPKVNPQTQKHSFSRAELDALAME